MLNAKRVQNKMTRGFPDGSRSKVYACSARDAVQSLGWEDPLEEEMATHSSILAWRIPRKRSFVGYSSWGHKDLDMAERLSRHVDHSGFLHPI